MPSTHTVRVDLAERSYDVVIGHQLLGQLGSFAKDRLEKRKCAVITSKTLVGMQYHGTTLSNAAMASLSEAGIETTLIDVPSGEQSKSLEVVADVCSRMLRAGLDRKSFVVALGGGVIGDLAGFAASIMMRGIPFIQVPTSLLAQVDSSVGGKTGVNTSEGKNLIGTFAQPTLVLADVDTLDSLPSHERSAGFAEIIKHAAIRKAEMFEDISAVSKDGGDLADLVRQNVEIKARIVEADEHETTGLRALLNFGHTVGHAIEASAGYGKMLHGEAIGLGMIAAAAISSQVAGLPPAGRAKILNLLKRFDLPTNLPDSMSVDVILDHMKHDKKFSQGKIRFVLLRSLGDAFVSEDVTEAHIVDAIQGLRF